MNSLNYDASNMMANGAMPRKKLGVIGGMGPAASAYFYELLTSSTLAETDQDHLEIYIVSRPSIPDRTAYILGKSPNSPVAPVIEAGNMLASLGADLIAIPCATTHHFYDELSKSIRIPIVHMIKETATYLHSCGVTAAGLMATDGAASSGLFQRELGAAGIRSVMPSPLMQSNVMHLIYGCIKAGKQFDDDMFASIADELRANGAQAIILACTELSLIRRDNRISGEFVDVLEILARRCIEICGACAISPLSGQNTGEPE